MPDVLEKSTYFFKIFVKICEKSQKTFRHNSTLKKSASRAISPLQQKCYSKIFSFTVKKFTPNPFSGGEEEMDFKPIFHQYYQVAQALFLSFGTDFCVLNTWKKVVTAKFTLFQGETQ